MKVRIKTCLKSCSIVLLTFYIKQIEATRLRILGLVRNDQGVYQCIAENDAGSVQSNAQLIVDNSGEFQNINF